MFNAYQRYFDFQGRASRSEWLFFLWVIILSVGAIAIDIFVFGTNPLAPLGLYGPAYLLVLGANFIPSLSVQIRRLHDLDRTGWWVLLSLVPIAGLVIFVFNLQPGTQGANRFGTPDGAEAEALQETFA